MATTANSGFAESSDPENRSEQIDRSFEDDEYYEDERRRFYASAGFGFDFNRGDYGEPKKTNTVSIPAFIKLEYEPVTVRLQIPYVIIDGSQDFIIDGDEGETATGSKLRDGIGDMVASFTYTRFPIIDYVPIIDVTTKIKIPTANDKQGIGTGKVDVTLQLEVSESFGAVNVFAAGGHRFKGGAPKNVWLASTGASIRVAERVNVGVAYDYRQGSFDPRRDSHEISPFASFRFGSIFRWNPYLLFGLSENAPDWGVGSTITANF